MNPESELYVFYFLRRSRESVWMKSASLGIWWLSRKCFVPKLGKVSITHKMTVPKNKPTPMRLMARMQCWAQCTPNLCQVLHWENRLQIRLNGNGKTGQQNGFNEPKKWCDFKCSCPLAQAECQQICSSKLWGIGRCSFACSQAVDVMCNSGDVAE